MNTVDIASHRQKHSSHFAVYHMYCMSTCGRIRHKSVSYRKQRSAELTNLLQVENDVNLYSSVLPHLSAVGELAVNY